MKRIFLASILFLSFFIHINAQLTPSVFPDVSYSDLQYIAVSGDNIYTFGSCDMVMVTDNLGADWSYVFFGVNVLDISIVPNTDGQKAYYLTKDKLFVFSMQDFSFTEVSDANLNLSAGGFRSIEVVGNKVYLVSNGSIHESTVGDYIWQKSISFGFENDYVRYTDASDSYLWIGSDGGKVLKFKFSDNSLTELIDFGSRISGMAIGSDMVGYVVVSGESNMFKTSDGGTSFIKLFDMPESISPLAYGEEVVMTVNTNRSYLSLDGGTSAVIISAQKDGYTNLVQGSFMTEDGILYHVGRGSMVLRSTDFGQSYTHLNTVRREDLYNIIINSNGEGYAVGGAYSIVRTTDNGVSWTALDMVLGDEDNFITSVEYIGNDRFLIGHTQGLTVIENGSVVSTTDGEVGAIMSSKVNNYILAIRRGADKVLIKSTDNGDTWIDLINVPGYPQRIVESNTGKIFIPSLDGNVITSVDGGENWSIDKIKSVDKTINSVVFMTDDIGLISVGNQLFLTTDGGETTTQLMSSYGIGNMHMFTENHFQVTISSGNGTLVRETENKGTTWKTTATYCTQTLASYYDGSSTVWLAHKGGHINKHIIIGGETGGVGTDNNGVLVEQIILYPNPVIAESSIFITHQLTNPYGIVYNMTTGMKVATCPSIGSSEFSLVGLQSGMYIIELIGKEGRSVQKFQVY